MPRLLPTGKISMLVAEANPMGGQLIAAALRRCRQYFDIVACCSNSLDGIQKLRELVPEIALISVDMQDGPLMGFRVLHELSASRAKTSAIMLMDCGNRDLVVDAFRDGARGIFSRDRSFRALSKCIRTVHSGQIWASNGDLEFLLDAMRQVRPLYLTAPSGVKSLTPREMDVVQLVADGMKNREISLRLNISEHTIRNYLLQIFEKLGVSSRVELVIYAFTRPAVEELGGGPASPRSVELDHPETLRASSERLRTVLKPIGRRSM